MKSKIHKLLNQESYTDEELVLLYLLLKEFHRTVKEYGDKPLQYLVETDITRYEQYIKNRNLNIRKFQLEL